MGKIIAVTGPREGVGKTTLAVNLATRYAAGLRRSVILLDLDPHCRQESAALLGASATASLAQLLHQVTGKAITIAMLRGRVPLNKDGVGVLLLAEHAREADHLNVEHLAFFLNALAQLYDVVIDVEAESPFRPAVIDLADAVIWSFLPQYLSVRSTVHQLEQLDQMKFGFQKFLMVLNQADMPGAMPVTHLAGALEKYGKEVDVLLPYETELTALMNRGRSGILENARSAYFQGVRRLAEKAAPMSRGASRLGTASATALAQEDSNGNGQNPFALLQPEITSAIAQETRARWIAIKQRFHRELVEELNIRRINLDTEGDPVKERQLRTNVESTVNALIGKAREVELSREERERLVKELVDEALGLGPLEELLRDPSVTEIMVNRWDQVFIERAGKIFLSDKKFVDNNHVVQVVRRIISPLGRRIDESVPMVDARLKDGSRVNAIIPPLAVQGPSLTIRRFPEKVYTAEDLIRMGSLSREMVDFLKVCARAKKNIIISGGTGTGKTTLLNMLSAFIPNDERIVTVEDTAELRLLQEHIVRLEARPANIEGKGQVAIRDLVKNCLRMRPDRIVVGECRGGEALDMLQAMNTGHDGSLTTIHANSPRDCFTRLETMCLMAGMDLPVWALREQIKSAVHLLVQLSRLQDGSRKVTCITEITGRNEETILTQDIFKFVQEGVDAKGKVYGRHVPTGNVPKFLPDLKAKGLELDMALFSEKGIS